MTPAERESIRDVVKGSTATLLLFLTYVVLPVVGTPAGIIAPFPALFYNLKQDRICGLAIVLTATAVMALIEPTIAVLYLFQCGMLSLLLAEFLRRGEGGARSSAGAVAGIALLTVVTAVAYSIWSGVDLNQMVRSGVTASIDQMAALYRKGNFAPDELSAIQEILRETGVMLGLAYPALLVLFMSACAGINLSLLRKSAVRLPNLPVLGQFSAYRNPDHLIWLVIAAGFSLLLLDNPLVYQAALNILLVTLGLYFLQGLAIIVSFFDRFTVSSLMRGFFYVMLAVQPYLAVGVTLFGLFDLWLNFRNPKTGENL